jgi:hypothetical protein
MRNELVWHRHLQGVPTTKKSKGCPAQTATQTLSLTRWGAKTHAVTQQRCTHESTRPVGLVDGSSEVPDPALTGV